MLKRQPDAPRHRLLLVLLGLLVLVSTGCQLRLATDVGIERDGSGSLRLTVALDDELESLLRESGVDLARGLTGTQQQAGPGWDVSTKDTDEGLRIEAAARFRDPAELSRLVSELHSALDDEDAALLRDVQLEVDEDGASRLRAQAGLELPTSPGVTGQGVAFDGQDLAKLLADPEQQLVRYDLRVTLPGEPQHHDADTAEGTHLTWHLPVGRMQRIRADGAAPSSMPWLLPLVVGLGAGLLAFVAVLAFRRRRQAQESFAVPRRAG